jgi:galactokinase
LDWLGYRCVAAAINIRVTVSLGDEASEFFDPRILDNVWELAVPRDPESPRQRPPIRVESDGPLASGLASSSAATLAAVCVYRSFHSPEGTSREDSESTRATAVAAAYEAERLVTNGGGMDHIAIASGGVVLLQGTRHRKPPVILGRIADPRGLALVVIDSGIKKTSGAHIARLRSREARNCPSQDQYCRLVDALSVQVWSAILDGDVKLLADAVNRAHEAMRDLQGMSTPLLEGVRASALAAGFPGVKITGSGSGGCLVAVTDSSAVGAQIAAFTSATSHLRPAPTAFPVAVEPREWRP